MPTVYDCLTCEDKPHFELHADMLKHITEKHGHIMGKTKYTSRLKMCLDGAKGWHQQIHTLDFGDYQIQEIWTSK
jgi:hypothetical protein